MTSGEDDDLFNGSSSSSPGGAAESSSESLSFEDVNLMYDICRYERAFRPEQASPWCSGLSEENLKVSQHF